jgi:hypothetical protein
VYFLNWDLTLPICHCCTSVRFRGWCYYLSCKLWKTLHFRKWTYVLPIVNTCTFALILLYFPLDDFIMFLALLCGICTSKTEHLYFPKSLSVLPSTLFIIFLALYVKGAHLKLNILHFPILLHILPVRIVLYFPRS